MIGRCCWPKPSGRTKRNEDLRLRVIFAPVCVVLRSAGRNTTHLKAEESMDTLANTVALVTGGGSGIGRAACQLFARAGAAVAVVDLRAEAAQVVADQITAEGGRAIALVADVSDEAAIADAIAQTHTALGGLHTVFANAGINGMRAPIDELTLAEWHATIDTNLTSTFLTV